LYPDLSYLFHDLLGTAQDNWLSIFKTFGFFLLLAFIVAARLLKSELERREQLGQFTPERVIVVPGSGVTIWDYIFNALFGFILGYKIPYAIANIDAWKKDPGGVLLSTDGWWITGLLAAAGFVAYYVYLARQPVTGEPYEKDVYPSERVGPITMMAAVGGLLGAKFFAIIEYMDRFVADPIGVLFSGDGLAIYGGLIGGALFVFLYLRKHRISPVPVMDAVAPSLIIAYWSFRFPHNVLGRGEAIPGCQVEYCTQLAEAVHPTSVYEMLMAFAIGGLLWALRKRLTNIPGLLFSIYLFFNGIERFFIEFARINDKYNVLGFELSQAQIIAICFMLAGLVCSLFFVRRARTQVQ